MSMQLGTVISENGLNEIRFYDSVMLVSLAGFQVTKKNVGIKVAGFFFKSRGRAKSRVK